MQADVDGGWAVVRDRIVDAHFDDPAAANDYASACAHRARRAGMAVILDVHPSAQLPPAAA